MNWIVSRLEVMSNILRFYLDGQRVGYEVEFSAAHNFLDPDLEKVVIGNAKQHVEGKFFWKNDSGVCILQYINYFSKMFFLVDKKEYFLKRFTTKLFTNVCWQNLV